MSAIPYRVSRDFARNNFNFPFQVYRALHDLMVAGDGIGFLSQYWHACNKKDPEYTSSHQAIFFSLRHVAFRTFQFHKVFEFIRINDIVEGMPTIGVAGAPCKESTVKHVLSELSHQHVLLKLYLPPSRAVTPLYGFNLPIGLKFLNVAWDEAMSCLDNSDDIVEGKLTRSMAARRTKNILECLCEYFENFSGMFDFLKEQNQPIKDLAVFMQDLAATISREDLKGGPYLDVISDLKSASRVRHSDLVPGKWKDISEPINT
jgi:hypothetical protein